MGTRNVIFNQTFANFTLNHPVANTVLLWMSDMLVPEESFYNTLIRLVKVKEDGLSTVRNLK